MPKKKNTNSPSGKEQVTGTKPKVSLNHATWASWFFLTGSLVLVVDAILENLAEVTLSSGLHLGGSLLFTLGSWLLVPRRPK